jgi:CheY-like chemotaxis protein
MDTANTHIVASRAKPAKGASGAKAGQASESDQQSPRILIVEDEIFVAWHLESLLKELDYSASAIVPDGRSAMRQAERLGVDLILMDINLKGDIDGVETARRIRETSDATIIFVTAYSDAPTLARIEAAVPGATVLAKPVSTPRLRSALDAALDARH